MPDQFHVPRFNRTLYEVEYVKLMLANSCWQPQTGMCEQHNILVNCWRKVSENRESSICRQQFANMLCRSHTPI